MKNLKKSLKTPLQIIPKWIPITVFISALIGFADAVFLTVEHYQNKIPPCSIGGCESVLTSAYATVWGIPVSIGGIIFYLSILILTLLYFDSKKELHLRRIVILSVLGFIVSLYFVSLMIFVLKAFCPYCAVSGITSTAIFISSVILIIKNVKKV